MPISLSPFRQKSERMWKGVVVTSELRLLIHTQITDVTRKSSSFTTTTTSTTLVLILSNTGMEVEGGGAHVRLLLWKLPGLQILSVDHWALEQHT